MNMICSASDVRAGHRVRLGFTLVECSVLVAIAALVVAILLPISRQLRNQSNEMVSMNNLAQIGMAQWLYGADWNDRQFTAVPDDLGAFSQSASASILCSTYVQNTGCHPSTYIGEIQNGAGFYVAIMPCDASPIGWQGSCSGAAYTWPYPFDASSIIVVDVGSFRYHNLAALNAYTNGRWYDDTYFAPSDVVPYEAASVNFDDPWQFVSAPNPPIFSSYCLSPAAMFHPDVFTPARPGQPAWNFTFAERFESPTLSAALYPDLKTHLIEHNWNQNPPALVNPNAPMIGGQSFPYQFNHGIDSVPFTVFFDGHIAAVPMAEAVADDARVVRQSRGRVGLWSRDTPLGANGYKGEISYDGTISGFHMLTVGGIEGRDLLSPP